MLSPQLVLPIHRELVIDLFAGGGGTSTGLERGLRRPVDIAVNHDREAVAMHLANHPQTKHYVSDVYEVEAREVTEGLPVGLLWASPDCTYHSKARGGKPFRDRNKARRRRGLAGVVIRWAKQVRPRVIGMENVEEFLHWGPLAEDGLPCPHRRGNNFQRWVARLRNLGYDVQWRELRGCDYGAPTIRKRLFVIARCDGQPIVWPKPSHADPQHAKALRLQPWRTAAECIDFSAPCPSIFERQRELAEATKRRIAKGVMRYVINDPNPYIVRIGQTGHGDSGKVRSLREPLSTVTSKNEHLLVQPHIAPLTHQGGDRNEDVREPMRTVTAANRGERAVVAAFLAQYNNHGGTIPSHGRRVDAPVSTITTKGSQQTLVASNLIKLRGQNVGSRTDSPLHTISAQGWHHGEVRAFLMKYYGTDQDPQLREPMHTVTTKHRFGVVMVKGQPYEIVDIGMRMLKPRELFRAQGFPEEYIIDWGIDPYTGDVVELTLTAQVRMCGNSVNPQVAEAIVASNYSEEAVLAEAA